MQKLFDACVEQIALEKHRKIRPKCWQESLRYQTYLQETTPPGQMVGRLFTKGPESTLHLKSWML
jgi:hypothetical protein